MREREHFENNEQEPKFIGRITLLRHGQTQYTEVYPDLTKEGQDTIQKSAEQIAANLKRDEEVVIVASDRARAQGTAGIIKKILKHNTEIKSVTGITSAAQRDPAKASEMINEILAEGKGIEAVDYAYIHDPRFDDEKIWEPKKEIQKRFFRNLEYTIRAFKLVAKHKELPKPHLIAVTHFEILNPLIEEVLNVKYPEGQTLKHGELIEISISDPSREGENADVVIMNINFRGISKTVGFDRKNRRLISLGK